MDVTLMPRDPQGKFALKNDEHRCVRSLRLTDTTWMALGKEAESLALTRADYLEQIFRNKPYSLPSNTRIKKEDLLSHTHGEVDSQPSNTWQNDETELLQTQLRQENAFLSAQIQNFAQIDA